MERLRLSHARSLFGPDSVEVPPLIDGITFNGLIADKAFDSNAPVAELNQRGANVVISP